MSTQTLWISCILCQFLWWLHPARVASARSSWRTLRTRELIIQADYFKIHFKMKWEFSTSWVKTKNHLTSHHFQHLIVFSVSLLNLSLDTLRVFTACRIKSNIPNWKGLSDIMSSASNGCDRLTNIPSPYSFHGDTLKCPWQRNQGHRKTGGELLAISSITRSPDQTAVPCILLSQQCCRRKERGFHSLWQALLTEYGTQKELLLQLKKRRKRNSYR